MKKKGILIVFLVCFLFMKSSVSAGLENILQLHLQYGNPKGAQLSSFSGNVNKNFSDDLRFIFSQSELFIQTNIPVLLETQPRKEKLISYLRDGNSLLQALKYHDSHIENELQTFQNLLNACESELSTANQSFSISITNNNENGFLQSVEQAKKARSCMGEQRVLLSANRSLKEKIKRSIAAIEPRVTYLQKNESLIIQHYDILKPSLLAELHRIALQIGKE